MTFLDLIIFKQDQHSEGIMKIWQGSGGGKEDVRKKLGGRKMERE